MTKFSANLGFLFTEHVLPDAIRAAAHAGFDAVECHWPYDVAVGDVKQALADTGLVMLGLNTSFGRAGEFGLSALVERDIEAKAAIDQAVEYGFEIGAKNVHVMAGLASGDAAHECFVENLHYACGQAAKHSMTVLIEPLNHGDAPGYFLNSSEQAIAIIDEVGADNLKLMFDCYHMQILEGDVVAKLSTLIPYIGHIQIASVPHRAEPDYGDLDYEAVFEALKTLEYDNPIGAEYQPKVSTEAGLGWLSRMR